MIDVNEYTVEVENSWGGFWILSSEDGGCDTGMTDWTDMGDPVVHYVSNTKPRSDNKKPVLVRLW